MIVTNEKEAQKFSDDLLERQLRLEKQFLPKIRSFLKIIGDQTALDYSTRRIITEAKQYNQEIVAILREQYRKVIREFGFDIRRQLRGKSIHSLIEVKQIDNEFSQQANEYVNRHSVDQSDIILTNERTEQEWAIIASLTALLLSIGVSGEEIAGIKKQPRSQRLNSLQFLLDINTSISDEQKQRRLNTLVRREMRKRSIGQAERIAMTETNNSANFAMDTESEIAEQDKDIAEAAVAAGVIGANQLVNGLLKFNKRWTARLDTKTRTSHAIADGQIVPSRGLFLIGESQARMRYPTDGTFGAPPEEIINCRCKAIRTLQETTLQETT